MSIGKSTIPYTYEDYQQLPESRDRVELIDGDLYVTPTPTPKHQIVSKNLQFALERHVRAAGLGLVLSAPVGVVLDDGDARSVVQPDLLFIDRDRLGIVTEAEIAGAPDLVVEILSPTTARRDTGLKKALYARAGVREYWLVDTDAESIAVLRLGNDGYSAPVTYGRGETLASAVVAGLELALDEVFEA